MRSADSQVPVSGLVLYQPNEFRTGQNSQNYIYKRSGTKCAHDDLHLSRARIALEQGGIQQKSSQTGLGALAKLGRIKEVYGQIDTSQTVLKSLSLERNLLWSRIPQQDLVVHQSCKLV